MSPPISLIMFSAASGLAVKEPRNLFPCEADGQPPEIHKFIFVFAHKQKRRARPSTGTVGNAHMAGLGT